MTFSRRSFLQTAAAATTALPYLWTSSIARSQDKNSRLRLGRKLSWNPTREMFVDDDEANAMSCSRSRSIKTLLGDHNR
jgi:hypothetical protein